MYTFIFIRCKQQVKYKSTAGFYPTLLVFLFIGVSIFSIFFTGCSRIQEQTLLPDNYQKWEKTTQTVLDYPVPGHENHFRVIYINDKANEVTIHSQDNHYTYEYPPGTIVIKEIYSTLNPPKNEDPIMLTAMIKAPEDDRSRGGWLWVVKDFKTKDEKIIDQGFCFTCHDNANRNHPYGDNNPNNEFRDYLFFPLKK